MEYQQTTTTADFYYYYSNLNLNSSVLFIIYIGIKLIGNFVTRNIGIVTNTQT
jgi:hypothetical protein